MSDKELEPYIRRQKAIELKELQYDGNSQDVRLVEGTPIIAHKTYYRGTRKDFSPEQAREAEKRVVELKAKTDEVEALNKKVAELLAREPEVEPHVKRLSDIIKGYFDTRADNAFKRLTSGEVYSVSPKMLADLVDYGASKILAGSIDKAQWMAEMLKNLGEKYKPEFDKVWGLSNRAIDDYTKKVAGGEAGKVKEARQPGEKKNVGLAAHKPGSRFSKTQIDEIWNHIRDIRNSGEDNYEKVLEKVSVQTGMPFKEIENALFQKKEVKPLVIEMYRKMADRRKMRMADRDWLNYQMTPEWARVTSVIPRVFFIDKVIGHGTSFMITHAGMNTMDPLAWGKWFPSYLKQYPLAYSKVAHERWAQDLMRDTDENHWTIANNAGLVNDPFNYVDEYQQVLTKFLGNKGGDGLKDFRQHRFNQKWNDLTPEEQTPEMAEVIADLCNHESGIIKSGFGKYSHAASIVGFAPKLEASRWAYLLGDTARSAKTLGKWASDSKKLNDPTVSEAVKNDIQAERYFAQKDLWKKARIIGMLYGSLVVNQGFLNATGSKQKINFTDSTRSDFLAFKAHHHTIGVMAPLIGIVRLFGKLSHDLWGTKTKFEQLKPKRDEVASTLFRYGQGKLSPFLQPISDVVFQSTFDNRPMPFSNDPVPSYMKKEGLDKHTWGEYTATQFSPIPAEEGIKEMWSSQGMDRTQQQKLSSGK